MTPEHINTAHFRLILEAAPIGMIAVGWEGRIVLANARAEKLFGYTRDELIGMEAEHLVPAEGRRSHAGLRQAYMRSPEARPMGAGRDLYAQRRDGTRFPVEIGLSAVQIGEEEQSTIIATVVDITERKQAEEALRKFSRIIEQTASTVLVTDAHGVIEYVNPRFVETTGYTAQEAIGKRPSMLKSGHTPPEEYRRLWDTITRGGVWQGEFHNRRKEGSLYWERAIISPVRNAGGDITHFTAIKDDITEQKQAQEALRQSEERFRLLVEGVKDYAILMLDPEGRVATWNEGARRLKGYDAEEIIGTHFSVFYRPEDRAVGKLGNELNGAITTGQFEGEGWRVRKDGSVFWASVSITALRDDTGTVRGFAKITRDLTERKRAEDALRERRRLSEIGRMATAIAHELNQPLAAVSSYIGGCRRILASGAEDEQRKRKVDQMMEQASVQALRAGEVIRRLREFVGSGERERSIEDAASLMHEACGLAITSARHDGVSVRFDIRQAGRVLVDKIQFQQVIINLARNAVEAMENSERKELVFGLAKNDDDIEVSVGDTGPGLDPDIADRLFAPFSTTKHGGMGIGLSVCREIVEAHEGKIWCEPNPGGGAVFRFTLPIVAEHMVG